MFAWTPDLIQTLAQEGTGIHADVFRRVTAGYPYQVRLRDEDTGNTLWQFQTSSGVNSTAITYTHKGRQYVTVASGLGGGLATRAANNKVPTGGSLWTFGLMPE